MSVEIKPVGQIETRLQIQPGGAFHKMFANTCMKHMDRFVPMEVIGIHRGALRGSAHVEQNGEEMDIVYNTPYAHYMYEGKVYVDPLYKVAAFPIRNGKISFDPKDGEIEGFVSRKNVTKIPTNRDLKYHTPGTGPHWDRLMVSADMDQIERTLERKMEWVKKS